MERTFILDSFLIGIIGGLLGVFYRNCLKVEGMIFHSFYKKLKKWERRSHHFAIGSAIHNPTLKDKLLGTISYPLGFCIYCSTPWITILIYLLSLIDHTIPPLNILIIGVLFSLAISHIIVCICCRFLIYKHPDLD